MFNYNCVMCVNEDAEWCYSGLCTNCSELKKIIDLYGIKNNSDYYTVSGKTQGLISIYFIWVSFTLHHS